MIWLESTLLTPYAAALLEAAVRPECVWAQHMPAVVAVVTNPQLRQLLLIDSSVWPVFCDLCFSMDPLFLVSAGDQA